MTNWTRRSVVGAALAAGLAPRLAAQDTASWRPAASLPVRTQEIYPAALNGRIYLAGGLSPDAGREGIGILDRVFAWTPSEPESGWQDIAPLPEPRHHPNLVAHAGAIYAAGGFHAVEGGAWGMLDTMTRYDPETDSWTEMRPLPLPYGETVAASLATGLHLATGRQPAGTANAQWTDHADSGAHYVYDASEDRWREAAPNPNPRNSAAGGVISGRLHVVGGRRVNAGNNADHEAYDPVSDRWDSLAPMPQSQGGLAAAVAGGRLYAFGGEFFNDQGGGVYPEVWIYDPDHDVWRAGPEMRTPRHGLGGLAIGRDIYSIAGATGASARGTSGIVEVLTVPA